MTDAFWLNLLLPLGPLGLVILALVLKLARRYINRVKREHANRS